MELTRQVVSICRPLNISVEAELGHVSGLEGLYSSDDYIYTDVNEARLMVQETDIDALAVAIGTVHGVYKETPRLNLKRLQELKQAVKPYLVLHGGSGLSDADFKDTIRCGITKVNIYTDLTLAALDSIRKNAQDSSLSYMQHCLGAADAVKQSAVNKMQIFGCCGKA